MAEAAIAGPHVVLAGTVRGRARTVLASVPIAAIRPNPEQPRRYFDGEKLAELAASIRARGILHPIIVKRDGDSYVIMAGERRYRAAQLAGLDMIPSLIRDDDPLEIAIIENLQREDLSPLEEAEGLGALSDQYGYTHETLADLIGKSRPYVSNTLTLRRLPGHIKNEYHASPDVSREILIAVARAESPERQEMLWRLAKIRRLSVQRFRAEQSGEPGGRKEILELARLVRRLARKLRALDGGGLSGVENEQLARLLQRAQARIGRTLANLAAGG
jgi:ParB family chromosome partitioning protein